MLELLAERLDPNPDARWKRPGAKSAGDLIGRRAREMILFGVGPRAEPVLEIDSEILDRFPRQLFDNAWVDAAREIGIELESLRQCRSARRVLVERLQRRGAKFL